MGKPDIIYEDNDIIVRHEVYGNCYTDQAYRAAVTWESFIRNLQGG